MARGAHVITGAPGRSPRHLRCQKPKRRMPQVRPFLAADDPWVGVEGGPLQVQAAVEQSEGIRKERGGTQDRRSKRQRARPCYKEAPQVRTRVDGRGGH